MMIQKNTLQLTVPPDTEPSSKKNFVKCFHKFFNGPVQFLLYLTGPFLDHSSDKKKSGNLIKTKKEHNMVGCCKDANKSIRKNFLLKILSKGYFTFLSKYTRKRENTI